MNRLIITLMITFFCVAYANAGDMYICVDESGNTVVTSIPQDGMKNCVLKDSYQDVAPSKSSDETKNTVEEKDKTTANSKEKSKETEARIKNCMSCCDAKKQICYNYTANDRMCIAEQQNCVATCNSEGVSSSSWSECWSQSEKQATEK